MKLVYYAHSYRPQDSEVVQHFADLMQTEGLIVSLDPPSNKLNAAKPERHLRSTDALVAVLTTREGGPSEYILFEIMLGIRAKKPVIVFVEDNLPDGCVSDRILQRRFSRRSLLREIRTHRHAIQILNSYLGENPPPLYQPSLTRRNCLIVGSRNLKGPAEKAIFSQIDAMRYSSHVIEGITEARLLDRTLYERILTADFALIMLEGKRHRAGFLAGVIVGYMVPSIILTFDPNYQYEQSIPREYQPKYVELSDTASLEQTINREISIFEEDYVDIEDKAKVVAYSKMLFATAGRPGYHSEGLRNLFVEELVMGSQYTNYGQAGAMGEQASGTINNSQEVWKQMGQGINLAALSVELGELRKSLRAKAETPEHDQALVAVGEAEVEASKGDGPRTLEKLARGGLWALGIAKEIGVKLATEALSTSLGLK